LKRGGCSLPVFWPSTERRRQITNTASARKMMVVASRESCIVDPVFVRALAPLAVWHPACPKATATVIAQHHPDAAYGVATPDIQSRSRIRRIGLQKIRHTPLDAPSMADIVLRSGAARACLVRPGKAC
jgi:hypothetical protein